MFPDGFIVEERIGCQVEATSKKKVLEQLGERLAQAVPELTRDKVFDALLERERLGSTGLGSGIALPHARMAEVETAIGAFIQLADPVDFDTLDGAPVVMAFAMLVPEEATDEHLQLLARLAGMFSDSTLRDGLIQATSSRQILDLLLSH